MLCLRAYGQEVCPDAGFTSFDISGQRWRLGIPLWGTALLLRHTGQVLSGVPGARLRFGEAVLLLLETVTVFLCGEGGRQRHMSGGGAALELTALLLIVGTSLAYHHGWRSLSLCDVLDAARLWPYLPAIPGLSRSKSFILAAERMPVAVVPHHIDEQLEECFDMKCPITLGLLVHPVSLRGKVYEQAAITKWIRAQHTVPHSPATPASLTDLQPVPGLASLLQDFRQAYGIHVEYDVAS